MSVSVVRWTSVAIAFMFVATLAAPGVAVAAARASAALAAIDSYDLPDGLAESVFQGDLRSFGAWFGDSPVGRPLFRAPAGPVEVVVGLEGRSLAAEQAYRTAMGMPSLGPAEERAYVASLRASQGGLRATLESLGAHVLHEYQVVYNGIAIVADPDTIGTIEALRGVARVLPTATYEIALDRSVPFIFGGRTNADLGADGTGITIAIIDSGIDYTHAAFGGSGDPADWEANNRTILEPGTFPTAKVIGGTDLVGEFYDARGFDDEVRANCTAVPVPDPDPLDHGGHGSHVAGITAGMAFDSFPQGVAPGASLIAIKLFSGCADDGTASTSSANVVAAIEIATDPNGDGDTSDHVDVINMSLGGAFGRNTESTAGAANAAADLGVIVVASAGNSGNIPYITGAPASAAKAISVAAGNDPGVTAQLVGVSGSEGGDGNYESLEAAITPPLSNTTGISGPAVRLGNPGTPAAQACRTGPTPSPPAEGSLAGKIPLIQRGVCTFAEKILNAQAAGAIAVVVYNNAAGAGPIIMGGDPTNITIPAVMLGTANGVFISARIDADTRFTLDPANVLPIPDRLQSFTSRGPRFGDAALKPDITAPGGAVFSVDVGTGTGGVSLSGTSMSSPHVAGVAALLRELHPSWSIAEIKSLLMNTATNAEPTPGVSYPVSLMGAGRVRVDAAAMSESVVIPGSLSFGVREQVNPGPQSFGAHLELRNKGPAAKTFALSSGLLFASDAEGSIAFSHPSTLAVGPGQSRRFNFGLVVNFSALAPEAQFEEYDGFLTLTETTAGGDVLRVPFHIVPIARAEAKAVDDDVSMPDETTFVVTNRGLRSTAVDVYQFGVSDRNEDLILEGPGMPDDPDDWFDVRMTGAHSFPLGATRVIEFGLDFHGLRSAPSLMVTEVYIDVDGGGPDFVAVVADDFVLDLAPAFTGRMVSALFNMTGSMSLQFVVNGDRNQGWQTVPIRLDLLNTLGGPNLTAADPDFEYFVITYDLDSGSFDMTAAASFNVFATARSGAPRFFSLAAGASQTITVSGSGPGDLILLYYGNRAGHHQGQRVRVSGP